MEKILIFIKHRLSFLWKIIEWCNGMIFCILHKSKLEKVIPLVFNEYSRPPYIYKKLESQDTSSLFNLLKAQAKSDLTYFSPHDFDIFSIKKQFHIRSFLMMGAFESEKLVGYFFLRFFVNKRCFVGRLIDKEYRGKGMGLVMNTIMYEIAWRTGFRCLSTISRNNIAIMKAHANNPNMIVLKELQNDYLLVEFIRKDKDSKPLHIC